MLAAPLPNDEQFGGNGQRGSGMSMGNDERGNGSDGTISIHIVSSYHIKHQNSDSNIKGEEGA